MIKVGWICLLVAVIGDFAVPYLLAPFYRGYSHTKQVMSVLGNPKSPVRRWYNLWLVALGLCLFASFPALMDSYWTESAGLTIVMFILIAFFAIGAGILSGLFSVNETKAKQTFAAKVHGMGASLGFMALAFAPLFLSILSFRQEENEIGILSMGSFVLAIVFFILFVMADKEEIQNTWIAKEGLWQRLTLLCMYLPFAAISIQRIAEG